MELSSHVSQKKGDVKTDEKTRKCTEGAAADKKHGDISSARTVDGPMSSTSFGKKAEPPALLICRNDALVDIGAEVSQPCLSLVERRTPTAAGGLLPAGTASRAIRTTFPSPSLWNFCPTEEMDFSTTTSIQT